MTGSFDAPFEVHSLWAMLLIEGFAWSPLVFLLLSATFRAANGEMEEAARMCGASVFSTIWRVSIRLAVQAILALGLFIFIRNLEAFKVPALESRGPDGFIYTALRTNRGMQTIGQRIIERCPIADHPHVSVHVG